MNVDFTNVADIEDLRAVPEGEYRCRVAETRESESPAGHTRWGLRWEILDGEWQGRTACWDSLHWSERGLSRVKFVLEAIGIPTGGEMELKAVQLEGKTAIVQIAPEEREDTVTGVRRVSNRVPFAGYRLDPKGAKAKA